MYLDESVLYYNKCLQDWGEFCSKYLPNYLQCKVSNDDGSLVFWDSQEVTFLERCGVSG